MSDRPPLKAVAGLAPASKLPKPPPRRVRPVEETAPEPVEDSGGGGEAAPQASRRPAMATEPRGKRRPLPGGVGPLRGTTLSLPVDLVSQVRERARAEGVVLGELLLDALTATREDLRGQFKDNQAAVSDGLFVRRSRRASNGATAHLGVRLLAENLDVIDKLVAEVGAPSRSALIAAALRMYLSR